VEGLPDKLQELSQGILFYEVIPPLQCTNGVTAEAYAECVAELVSSASVPVAAINLPEIRDEQRDVQIAGRTHPYEPKTDARRFGQRLKEAFKDPVDLVINRCTVYESWSHQHHWLQETHAVFDIKNLVLVGGETGQAAYPGPSVTEMAQSIRREYGNSFTCGGITIPTRRSDDPKKDEPHRLLHKTRHGLEFFTSQVLYEPQSTQRLLADYSRLCAQSGQKPKRIFLSFAPVCSSKDLDFLKWLGVEIPEAVERNLLKADMGIGWRSLREAQRILHEILQFAKSEASNVPLGLNIEHITRRNFELSKDFIEELGMHYGEHIQKRVVQ
jgi:5,10-methylenetetrahydrofolate reductase